MIYTKDKRIEHGTYSAVTLGNFDGLHLGHQKLVHSIQSAAGNLSLKTVVFSFAPHPALVLGKKKVLSITSSKEKIALLEKMNVDLFVEYPFDENFAFIEPEYFVRHILCKQLKCKFLAVGEDYRFGRCQKGDVTLLKKLGVELGFEVGITPHVMIDDNKVSSSNIRDMISNKEFTKAEKYMGRPFFVLGNVEQGKKIGRTLNFPTVNIHASKDKLLPPDGVYCTKTLYNDELIIGVTNVGTNPTIGDNKKTIETFLFGFNREIYGEQIEVYFYKGIREEIKFNTVEDLKNQILADTQFARKYFEDMSSSV